MGVKRHDQDSVTIYIEQFCSKADVVYRFAIALTLNAEAARDITRAVYQQIGDEIESLGADSAKARSILLKTCWTLFKKQSNNSPAGQSPLIAAVRDLSVDARAAIVAVDYAGVRPDELEAVFGWDAKKGRALLAEARRQLITTDIKV